MSAFIHFICTHEQKAAANRLAARLATDAKPGAIILLEQDEWDVLQTMRSVQIGDVVNPGVHIKEIPGGQE